MSWFLRKKKLLVLASGSLLAIVLLFTTFWFLSILIFGGVFFVVLNHVLLRKMARSLTPLSSVREIKSYDTLVIGEDASSSEYKAYFKEDSAVVFASPERSLEASYQILLHTSSCIKEGGTCIILEGKHASHGGYSLFDVPYVHPITRKELQIEHLVKQSRLPLLYEPIKSLKILLHVKKRGFFETDCSSVEIKNYCNKKGFHLIYLANNKHL